MMKRLRNQKGLFPTLNSTVAYYDTTNFCINFNEITEKDMQDLSKSSFPPSHAIFGNLKTLAHELRHAVDHVATLWGQNSLLKYARALNARLSKDINRFNEVIDYKYDFNKNFYDKYYLEHYQKIDVKSLAARWTWRITCGLRFTSRGLPDTSKPIPFIVFGTHDEKKLVRVPLSIASILETNAVKETVELDLGYIAHLSETERPFHQKQFENETLLNLVYNQEMVLYNAAVHLTANILDLKDFALAFKISSSIGTLALNLPNSLARKLPFQGDRLSMWGERTQLMLNNQEYGLIFFILLQNYADVFVKSGNFNMDEVLNSNGLPVYSEILKILDVEFRAIQTEIEGMENFRDLFLGMIHKGRSIFNELGIGFEKKSFMEGVERLKFAPTFLYRDTSFDIPDFSIADIYNRRPIQNLDFPEWYSISWALQNHLTELFDVRGI